MNLRQFIKAHRKEWKRLEHLITTLSKEKRKVSSETIHEFHRTYLKVTQALSYSQTYFPKEEVTLYLNDLVAKAHNLLYRDKVSSRKQLKQFFSRTFIKLLLEQKNFVYIACSLFLIGAFAAFISVLLDPLHVYTLLPNQMTQGIDPEALGTSDGFTGASLMSAVIMTNNIQVAFISFAGGITFGVLTVFILIYNGILLGALAAVYWHADKTYEFWAYIVPHGIIELTAIFIAGGAGLLMGYRLFVPGPYSRGHQLKIQARRSVLLLIGTIPLFIIAGIIEGYVTPATISLEMKYFVALLTVIGLILYVLIGKRLINQGESQ